MEKIPKNHSTFCVAPWVEVMLSTESLLFPCCISQPIKDEKGKPYNLVEDYWNGYGLKEVKKNYWLVQKLRNVIGAIMMNL